MTARFPDFPPVPPGWHDRANAAAEHRFRYVGEEYRLPAGGAWAANPSPDKEWLIAHHKFYAAVDLAQAAAVDTRHLRTLETLLRSWLDEMGVGHPIQSDAQVEAKRVENWFWTLSLLPPGTLDPLLHDRLLRRIDDEARYIVGHLKRARNHRTFQLYAVALAAVLSPDLTGDLRQGAFTLLTENLLTDIGLDGVHGELSSHYHNLVAETAVGFLELADRNGLRVPAELRERTHRAVRFSLWLQWPNGDLPLINDADNGRHQDLLRRGAAIFQDPELTWGATLGAAGRPPTELSLGFDISGYAVLRGGWGPGAQHVLYDRAMLGEGSHSHYDLFSFTYFADGAPAVVDPGRFTYSAAPDEDGVDWRHHFKSTAAHNTVTVDGLDQTRYLSRTKHGPEVELIAADWLLGGDTDCIVGTARSVEYAPLHRRTLFYPGRRYLLLLDELFGVDGGQHSYAARFHLPDTSVEFNPPASADGRSAPARLTSGHCVITALVPAGGTARVDGGWMSTTYGVRTPAAVLDVAVQTAGDSVVVTAAAPRSGPVIERLERVGAGAVRISGTDAGQRFADVLLFANGAADGVSLDGQVALVRATDRGWKRAVGHRIDALHLPGGSVLSGDWVNAEAEEIR